MMALLGLPLGGQLSAPTPEVEIVFYQDVAWSPDGKQLASSAMRISRALWEKEQFGALQKSQFDLHLISVDNSPGVRVTDTPGNDLWAAWWPSGRCLLYAAERDGSSGLYFVKADGWDRQAPKGLPEHATQPAVSPDGKQIAFMSRQGGESHIYVDRGDVSAPRKLSSAGPNNWNPVWSPAGTKLLFYSDRRGKRRDQIFVVNADGSAETQLTKDEFNNVFPSWSPDGKRLAFISGEFPDTQIYIADADGANPTQLTR